MFLIKMMVECVWFSMFFKGSAHVPPHVFHLTMNLKSPHRTVLKLAQFFHCGCHAQNQQC